MSGGECARGARAIVHIPEGVDKRAVFFRVVAMAKLREFEARPPVTKALPLMGRDVSVNLHRNA